LKFRDLSDEFIDSLPGIFVLHDENGRYLRWNKQFERETGYSREEILDLHLNNFFDGSAKEAVEKGFKELLSHPEGEILRESKIVIKGGARKSFYFKGKRILYEGRQCIISTGVDISDRKRAEEELKNSEANLHTILDNTDTIYVLLDKDLSILSYNQRALDFAASELGHHTLTSHNFLDYFPADRRAAITRSMNKVIAGDPVDYETSYPKPDSSFTWYNVKMFPVFNGEKKVLGIVTAALDITQKKLLELEILNQKVQEQKKITRAVIKAQEKERTKIGQELHDNVNQILASARIYLTASREKNRDDKGILVKESIGLIDNAIQELRFLARNEITPQGKLDLRQLIQPLVDNLNEHAVISTKFDYCMAERPVDTDLKLNIYRIVQEQITNILKHSCASSAYIKLNGDDRFICLSVTDDGKGFETANSRKGVGITNIMNRIESFNGEFSLQSSPGNGCKLSVRFPR
jgi:PAS domain S-box-containing protein